MRLRAVVPAELKQLGEHEVEIRMMTGRLARDGHIVEPSGAVLDNYLKNPVQLWQHNPEFPVARNEDVRLDGDSIVARTTFAPAGVSAKADEIRGLVKSGIVSSVSIGFDVLDAEPLDPKKPRGGLHITRWELLECSFVSVPADPGALVTARELAERAAEGADWKVGASRDLPVEDSDAWDGPAAEASIFEHAAKGSDTDDFKPAEARKGFLVYDAGKPELRGSYKLPIAHVSGGELKVPKGAIRAAASRLPQTDIPDDVKASAEGVLNHYKEKAGIGDDDKKAENGQKTPRAAHPPDLIRGAVIRGMYGVSNLAWLLDCLNDAKLMAQWEAELEADASAVPAKLALCVKELGAVLVAMTEEEVAELLAGDEGDMAADHMEIMTMTANPLLQRLFVARAGVAVSAANKVKLADAAAQHEKAMGHHQDAEEAHAAIGERCRGISAECGRATDAHEKMGAALDAGDLDEAKKQHARIKRNMDAIADHNTGLGDEHEAMGDAHRGIARCVRAAQRCVRAVAAPGGDGDSKEVQTSDGAADSGGSENDRAYRQRQAEKLRLRAA